MLSSTAMLCSASAIWPMKSTEYSTYTQISSRRRRRQGGRTVALATEIAAIMPAENPTSVSVARWAAQSQPESRKIQNSNAVSSTAATWKTTVITRVRTVPRRISANPVTSAKPPATKM